MDDCRASSCWVDAMGWPLLLWCNDWVDQGQEPFVGHGESELTVGHPSGDDSQQTLCHTSVTESGRRLGLQRAYDGRASVALSPKAASVLLG